LRELLSVEFGPPLHSLVIVGEMHFVEAEMIGQFKESVSSSSPDATAVQTVTDQKFVESTRAAPKEVTSTSDKVKAAASHATPNASPSVNPAQSPDRFVVQLLPQK